MGPDPRCEFHSCGVTATKCNLYDEKTQVCHIGYFGATMNYKPKKKAEPVKVVDGKVNIRSFFT